MGKNKKFISKSIYYILAVSLVSFITGEIFLRIFWEPSDKKLYPYLKNPYLLKTNIPNAKLIGSDISYDEKWYYETNAFGFRSSSMKNATKSDNTYRIFFIGGSTVHQRNLQEKDTSWKIIEDYLNNNISDIRFECINAGISATTTSDSIALLSHEIIHYEPDMIIVMHAINDLFYGCHKNYQPTRRRLITHSASFEDILINLYKKSYLLIFLKQKIYNRFKNINPPKSERILFENLKIEYRKLPKKTYEDFPSLAEFLKNIKSLIGIANAHHIRICFLTEPHLYHEEMSEDEKNALFSWIDPDNGIIPTESSAYRGMRLFNEHVRALCQEYGVEYIDLEAIVPKNLRYFLDQVHTTPDGAKLIAEIVSDYLWDKRSKFEKIK